MTNEEIIREFASLPPEARRQAEDFINFLRQRYGRTNKARTKGNLTEENFVGMWKDREDLQDSVAFVRELREKEWGK